MYIGNIPWEVIVMHLVLTEYDATDITTHKQLPVLQDKGLARSFDNNLLDIP